MTEEQAIVQAARVWYSSSHKAEPEHELAMAVLRYNNALASLPSNPEHDTYGAPPVGALTDALAQADSEGARAVKYQRRLREIRDALSRMLPTFDKLLKGVVFTADVAGQVNADMAALRKQVETGAQADWPSPTPAPSEAVKGVSTAEPEGWKLVPIEPTEEMLNVAHEVAYVLRHNEWRYTEGKRYAAMIAAAPSHPPATPAVAVQAEPLRAALQEWCDKQNAMGTWYPGDGELSVCQVENFLATHPKPAAPATAAGVPSTCDGFEQPAFEEWAREHRFNMGQHPMFYVFLDRTTAGARAGWKAGLEYAVKKMSAGAAQPAKEQPHDR